MGPLTYHFPKVINNFAEFIKNSSELHGRLTLCFSGLHHVDIRAELRAYSAGIVQHFVHEVNTFELGAFASPVAAFKLLSYTDTQSDYLSTFLWQKSTNMYGCHAFVVGRRILGFVFLWLFSSRTNHKKASGELEISFTWSLFKFFTLVTATVITEHSTTCHVNTHSSFNHLIDSSMFHQKDSLTVTERRNFCARWNRKAVDHITKQLTSPYFQNKKFRINRISKKQWTTS